MYGIVEKHGYEVTAEEELVTTGGPPSPTAPYKEKKCWRRSFVLDVEALSNTTAAGSGGGERAGIRQRMLTSLVCQDVSSWFAGFRVLE